MKDFLITTCLNFTRYAFSQSKKEFMTDLRGEFDIIGIMCKIL